ncbi:MAG: phospholipase D/Transphosphatidylase [Thermoleophilia bacterium]|nr:phospholipase D/Transphosphatidylase [Thermoleophilia bacterium]
MDEALGDAVERAVVAHHRRRLRRQGWARALDPAPTRGGQAWAEGHPPPREESGIEVLVDGDELFARIVAAIEGARRSVHVASWWCTPDLELPDGSGGCVAFRDLLARAAERVPVRMLQWAGAPLPGAPISRASVRRTMRELADGTQVRWRVDARERPLHCHHEKLVIVDDAVAFVGGIDITDYQGDRRDDPRHPLRGSPGWHDLAVELRGPVVHDATRHFVLRWSEAGDGRDDDADMHEDLDLDPGAPPLPKPPGMRSAAVQLVRTVPERIYRALPHGDFSVAESYIRAIRSAREFIYLENQFLWSPEIVAELCALLCDPPTDEFRLLLVIPAKPVGGADDTRGQLGALLDADAHADDTNRVLACCPWSRPVRPDQVGEDPVPIYVHAKVGIVDDRWMSLGSANLNEHSLFNDTELNVVSCDPGLARDTRLRLWSEHLELPVADLEHRSPTEVFDHTWGPIAREQGRRMQDGLALTHRIVELNRVSRRSARLLGPLQSLLLDG